MHHTAPQSMSFPPADFLAFWISASTGSFFFALAGAMGIAFVVGLLLEVANVGQPCCVRVLGLQLEEALERSIELPSDAIAEILAGPLSELKTPYLVPVETQVLVLEHTLHLAMSMKLAGPMSKPRPC